MINKYFTVEVKPTITASLQHGNTVAIGDVLFDWTSFDIPKGSSKLIDVTMLLRGTNGVRQEASIDFYFAKSADGGNTAPSSLGTLSATADGTGYQNQLIGTAHINKSDFQDGLDIMAVASTGRGSGSTNIPGCVLTGEPETEQMLVMINYI